MNIKGLEGYSKINESYTGGLKKVYMFNPDTNDFKSIVCDDTEYWDLGRGLTSDEFPFEVLEQLWKASINEDVKKIYNIRNNVPFVGAILEVVKGKKYTHGTSGCITSIYDYKDRFGRFVAEYALTDNGLKIDTKNIKIVG